MAVEIGTATGYADLWSKLLSFLKTNSTLVSLGQNWLEVWSSADNSEKVLIGPGLSASDQIYVGLKLTANAGADAYSIDVSGYTGVLSSSTSWRNHINPSPASRMFVDSGAMNYWFIASGRRFMVVVQISTVFESMYCGFFLPYGAPTSYPYPLFIGGSASANSTSAVNWRSTSNYHAAFPFGYAYSNADFGYESASMLDPSGTWVQCAGYVNFTQDQYPGVGIGPAMMFATDAYSFSTYDYSIYNIRKLYRDCFGGGYSLEPFTLARNLPKKLTYGVLDGCYAVTGFANASQNIVNVSGKNHLVVQNTFRTNPESYMTMVLE